MAVVYDVEEIIKKLRPIFETKPINKAILFGSYSKGIASTYSDIDIVIDSGGQLRGLKFYSVLEDLVEALNKDVDLFDVSEIRHNSPIQKEILEWGVVLYER